MFSVRIYMPFFKAHTFSSIMFHVYLWGSLIGSLAAMLGQYELSKLDSAQRPVFNQWLTIAMQLANLADVIHLNQYIYIHIHIYIYVHICLGFLSTH